MNDRQLHVVFGAGQVGRTLAAQLSERGLAVRVISRSRPSALAAGIEWRAADASDPDAAAAAAAGASVVYQCLNAPYTDWPNAFRPLQRGVMSAAERTGALLVSLENIYAYGPTVDAPMTEDLPLAATTVKGRTRARMTEELMAASARRTHPHRDRSSIGFLRRRRHRVITRGTGLRQRRRRKASGLHRQPRPPAHLQLCP